MSLADELRRLFGSGQAPRANPGGRDAAGESVLSRLFPDLGTDENQRGFRDLATAFMERDSLRQQELFDQAAQRQRGFEGEAAQALRDAGAGAIRRGESGLEEIRGMTQEAQARFDAESGRIRSEAADRQLGFEASQIAGTQGALQAQMAQIDRDPMLTAAQRQQLKTELRSQMGQQASGVIAQSQQAHQAMMTGLETGLLQTDVGLRQANMQQIGAAYDRLQQAEIQAGQLQAQGFTQLAQLSGQADGMVSLFGNLANLLTFDLSSQEPIRVRTGQAVEGGPQMRSRPGGQMRTIRAHSQFRGGF